MGRASILFIFATATLGLVGCGDSVSGSGSGSGSGGGGGGGGGPQLNPPKLIGISPSTANVGSSPVSLVAYGSNFGLNPYIAWNGTALATSCVEINLIPTSCSSATALTATVPSTDFAAVGTATVTLANPASVDSGGGSSNALNFSVVSLSSGNTWVRTVAGVSVPNDLTWDAVHGKLYVSVGSADPSHASMIAVIDPAAGDASSFVSAGNNPNLLSISSDSGFLWAGMDGSNTVQRFLLPGLSKDISFAVPPGQFNSPGQAVALQAAPVSAHTVALIPGNPEYEPTGNGVYVYDDAIARPTSVPGYVAPAFLQIDWMQWGADDTTIYGDQYTTSDTGGIATMAVNSSGVTLSNYNGGLLVEPTITQFDRSNGLLYSYGAAFDPTKPSVMGSFDLPDDGPEACTADSALGRYYCVLTYSDGGTDVSLYELWTFDLHSYALLNRCYFGATAGILLSPITGAPQKVVRWGNAGLAVLTSARGNLGNGGIFLIDGEAVNPNSAPDTTSGVSNGSYASLSMLTPDVATTTSGEVQVTIQGKGFSPDSTACWNCNYLQFRYLPTTYVSASQLNVTIPLASVSLTDPLEISVFDQGSNLFSSNALTFSVMPASGTTQVAPINLCGLAMAWDENSQLLYVGTADYDGSFPNSVVAVNPVSGTIVKSQVVEPDPIFLSDSANGDYLYVAYDGATNLTQLELPSLSVAVTTPLTSSGAGGPWLPGDLKAAPQNPHTVAATLIVPGFQPEALGGIAIFDDGNPRPTSLPGWGGIQSPSELYDTLAWSASDELLTSAPSGWDFGNSGPLVQLQVNSSGVSYLGQGTAVFDTAGGYTHSDFGTNLIYSDGGSVADPTTGAVIGNYGASGLAAPDSSLNRVFILGQTAAQAGTIDYTVESFDQKALTPISSITLNSLSGYPIAIARWGTSGLAVLTAGGLTDILENGEGMLYLVQDAAFVSSAAPAKDAQGTAVERVQQRWKRLTNREVVAKVHQARNEKFATAH